MGPENFIQKVLQNRLVRLDPNVVVGSVDVFPDDPTVYGVEVITSVPGLDRNWGPARLVLMGEV